MVVQNQSGRYGRLILTPPFALAMMGHCYLVRHGHFHVLFDFVEVALVCARRVEELPVHSTWLLRENEIAGEEGLI